MLNSKEINIGKLYRCGENVLVTTETKYTRMLEDNKNGVIVYFYYLDDPDDIRWHWVSDAVEFWEKIT